MDRKEVTLPLIWQRVFKSRLVESSCFEDWREEKMLELQICGVRSFGKVVCFAHHWARSWRKKWVGYSILSLRSVGKALQRFFMIAESGEFGRVSGGEFFLLRTYQDEVSQIQTSLSLAAVASQ